MKYEPLVLPPNEIGWSDESFDLAVRYIMRTASLAEVGDMYQLLQKNVPKDAWWGATRQLIAPNIFKRSMLLIFRYFEPSVMQNAYNEIKQNPRPHLRRRNVIYAIVNIAAVVLGISSAIFLIFYLLS